MNKDPQNPNNLGAARACDNTRMMLLEYTLGWFALNVPSSKNKLSARFDLLLDTNVIDMITLEASLKVNGTKCELTQEIDALALQPEHISGSDLAGLIAVLTFLIQNVAPISKKIVKIHPSVPAIVQPNLSFFNRALETAREKSTYFPQPINPAKSPAFSI